MEQNGCQVRVWGVRGSRPAPGAAFAQYGGETSCFSAEWADAAVALDAGSGLAAWGEELVRRGVLRADILVGHPHLDHVLGLFAFPLLARADAQVHIYGRPGLRRALRRLMAPPWWPVTLADCAAQVRFHEVVPGRPFRLAGRAAPGLTVIPFAGAHPGGCLHYRLERGGGALAYALDCEPANDAHGALAQLARGARLLVWDAGFFPGEAKPGWGHSTWEEGLALGRRAGAAQVLMAHFGPEHTDALLARQEARAVQADARCRFAKEGMVIRL